MNSFDKNDLYFKIKHLLVQNFPGSEKEDYNNVTNDIIELFEVKKEPLIKNPNEPKTKGLFKRVDSENEENGVWEKRKYDCIKMNNDFEIHLTNPVTGAFEVKTPINKK